MTLNDLKNAYLAITPNVYHFTAGKPTGNYIVWAEDGQGNSVSADNKMQIQTISGTTDYFTKTESDPAIAEIQNAHNALEIAWYLNSVQYEDDTGYLHFEWCWEVDSAWLG